MSNKIAEKTADTQILVSFICSLFGLLWLSIIFEPLAFAFAMKYKNYCSNKRKPMAKFTVVLSLTTMIVMALCILWTCLA